MQSKLKLFLSLAIVSLLIVSIYLPTQSVYGATGTSVIEVSSPVLNITAGSSASSTYTVKLNSGTTWGTDLAYKSSTSGIGASFSKASGDPTFSGKMTVSVASSVSPGKYQLTLYATGDDPAPDTTVSVNVLAVTVTREIGLFSQKTVSVSATSMKPYTLSVKTPGSYNLAVMIPSGTYALINGTMESSYSFTLATFNQSSSFPSQSQNYTTRFFFVFEVNRMVSVNISLVNSSGDASPVMTEINSPSNWTSYTFLGGGLIDNGSEYNYAGGSYAFGNTWSYNSSSSELVNQQFFKPVPWVFLEPVNNTAVTILPSGLSGLTIYIIIAVVVVIAIVGIAVGVSTARKRGRK